MCPHLQPVRRHVNWPEESRDVAAEVRNWVVNKGLGETVLHKAARLQYHVCTVHSYTSGVFIWELNHLVLFVIVHQGYYYVIWTLAVTKGVSG